MLLWSSSLKSSQKNYSVKRLWSLCGRGIELGKPLANLQKEICRSAPKLLHFKMSISKATSAAPVENKVFTGFCPEKSIKFLLAGITIFNEWNDGTNFKTSLTTITQLKI